MEKLPSSAISDESIEDISLDLEPIDLSLYTLKEEIGRDKFSRFYAVIEKETNKKYVAKILQHSSGYLNRIKSFFKEVEILSKLNSPFILKYIGYSLKDFKGLSSPTIINEFSQNDTLEKLIQKDQLKLAPPEWNETKKLIVIYGIALGMPHIHSKDVNHHSLNTGSIFLDEYLLPKISSFEMATFQKDEKIETKKDRQESPLYSAPELFNKGSYTKASDVYSFSLIIYEIITGKKPFEKVSNFFQFFSEIANGKRPEIDPTVPPSYANLIRMCWAQDPNERPTFDQIVSILKSDTGFRTNLVNEDEFLEFVESIEHPSIEQKFCFRKVHIEYPEEKELTVDLDPVDLNNYTKVKFVGEGQFGKVFIVEEKSTNNKYAAKVNKKLFKNCKAVELANLSREINILSKLNSPLILKFVGYSGLSFSGKKKPTIITEFSENSLLDKIIELQNYQKNWTDTKMLITAYGIAAGMSFLHFKNILHRDFKPGNIFFDKYLFPKIGDFGLAIDMSKDSCDSSLQVGTPAFMAPEILTNVVYTKAGDVYAYGVLLYQLVTHKDPYKNVTSYNLVQSVIKGFRPEFPTTGFNVPDCYKKLIQRCWDQDPNKRPTFDEIVSLLENNKEFITDQVDSDEFYNYIKYISSQKINDSFHEVCIDFEQLKKDQEKDPTLNVSFLDLNKFVKLDVVRKDDHFKVCKVKDKENDKLCEAKISRVRITNFPLNAIIHLSKEINILSQLNHLSFLKFIGYSPIDFNKQPMPVIITEMPSNQSLSHLLMMKRKKKKCVKEWDDTKKLINIFGIASGMSYLRLHDIIHRNLCPESIFLDEYIFPKIGNFNLLTKLHSIDNSSIKTSIGIKGNLTYSSPELLKDNEYSKSSDVYAFALICYEIMTLKVPFEGVDNIISEVVVKENRPCFDVEIPNCYKDLIESCWAQNPEDRPTFEQIAEKLKGDSEFITENVNKEMFIKYIKFIENSKIDFYSNNRVVSFDDIIEEKSLSNFE